ncbi:hypothetical protein RB653_002394 [Dictyostelium firmibasis]|uniref:Uncharacterized protein n=1 Tax=Dictyostelium firmibasis TaxID=79012 RepID=A0AAN7TXD0_9MYCE
MTFLLNFKIKSHDKTDEKIHQCNKIIYPQQQQQQQNHNQNHINYNCTTKINEDNCYEKKYKSNDLSNSKQLNSSLKISNSKNIIQNKQKKLLEQKKKNELKRNYSNSNNNKEYWKRLLFTDLHVSSKSLDRTIDVLKKVRELSCLESINNIDSNKGPTPVIFLGDFWHQRNILHVRHIDRLLKEFEEWKKCSIETIFIPGNHDQVSIDGSVHGIQMFSLFPNFKVATDPIIDYRNGFAYLPWREQKEEQKQLFTNLSTIQPNQETSIHNKWTVFAHAEIKGAISNGGYKSNGKFQIEDLNIINNDGIGNKDNNNNNNSIRSCYLGHYHKRQQISNNFWYIGSPYQQNFGEMNDPHGVAFVDSDGIKPRFVDFNDLPRHHKLYFPFDLKETLELIKSKDIVEVKSTLDNMKSKEYIDSINSLPPFIDLRRVMINENSKKSKDNEKFNIINNTTTTTTNTTTTPIRFKLEDFLENYINQQVERNDLIEEAQLKKKLLYLGKEILSMVNEPTIVPMGRKVKIQKISVKDFCGLGGELELNLLAGTDNEKQLETINRMIMIRGEMGSGKSTIFEALVWCLYGNTSPKKQSSSSSSIKGDEVINDQSKQTIVKVELLIDDCKPIEIIRSKNRKLGSKIVINGLDDNIKQGVLDQQSLINNIIGLDYDCFRMSIYLGQGSISNFVTDTDKRKKELLSRIFSLGTCIPAAKLSKDLRKKKKSELDDLEKIISNEKSSLTTWSSIDFQKQLSDWSNQKSNNLLVLNQQLEKDLNSFNSFNNLIKDNNHNNDNNKLKNTKEKINEIYKLIKSLENEKDSIQRDSIRQSIQFNEKSTGCKYEIKQIQFEIKNLKDTINHLNQHLIENKCNQCGQTLKSDENNENTKQSIRDNIENSKIKVDQLENEIKELENKYSNSKLENDSLKKSYDEKKSNIQLELIDKQSELQSLNKQIEDYSKIEINLNYLKESINDRKRQIQQVEESLNPFDEKIKERQHNIEKLLKSIEINESLFKDIQSQLLNYQFWENGFNASGLPLMVLLNVIEQVETYANQFLSVLSKGRLFTKLSIDNQEELSLEIFELSSKDGGTLVPRSFYQLSGGQRRCVELSYSPFALSEVVYNHSGSRVTTIIIDELTNHLDSSVKPIICDLLRNLQEKDSVIVIDHDISVQSEFDQVFNLEKSFDSKKLKLNLIQ